MTRSGPDWGSRRSAALLAGVLTTSGVLHFVLPQPFDGLIPDWLPGSARTWTYASGVIELGTAALLAAPGTRRRGGLAAAILFIGVFPGNIKMAVDWSDRSLAEQAVAYARLPLQLPLVLWGLRIAKIDLRAAMHERIG
ncbi:MAG TPA: hypothetical protein VLR26_18425 [Frankiaceae bacterium]|nr:hypothetical protein [Frankiaceae bacterium]